MSILFSSDELVLDQKELDGFFIEGHGEQGDHQLNAAKALMAEARLEVPVGVPNRTAAIEETYQEKVLEAFRRDVLPGCKTQGDRRRAWAKLHWETGAGYAPKPRQRKRSRRQK